MLTITRRDCLLGAKASADAKEIDGQEIKHLTIEVSDVMLDDTELNSLLCEPHAHGVLFNTGVSPAEPYLKSLKALRLAEACEHAYAAITYGLDRKELIFADCKLSKIELEPTVGGLTALSCKITVTPALDESLTELFDHLGGQAEVELRANPPGAQQDLPLNQHGEGEAPEMSSIGRQIQNAARKRRRREIPTGRTN